MHEMSIAQSVLEIVEETARRNRGVKVRAVWLEIGALSTVVPEALRFCFDAVVRGTIVENASLHIETTPGMAWCLPCGTEVPLASIGDSCPQCGSYQLSITRGNDMRVKEIEIA